MSSFRITMGMKMNKYRFNLMGSTNRLYHAQEKVDTHRKFNSYAEAPADATHAWRIRREIMDNDGYARQNSDTQTRFETAWRAMGTIKNGLVDGNMKGSVVRALNDPTGQTGKQELGQVLINCGESMIQTMNGAKYGHTFVFSGTDGANPPFAWTEDGKLTYRGIPLDDPGGDNWASAWGSLAKDGIPENFAGVPDPATWTPKMVDELDADGNPIPDPDNPGQNKQVQDTNANGDLLFEYTPNAGGVSVTVSEHDKEWYTYFKNMNTLNKMSDEVLYSDMGMGMKMEDNGDINGKHIESTYFNNALPGINMLGYGVDEDGDPKNFVLLANEIADMLKEVDENGQSSDPERLNRLAKKFDDAIDYVIGQYTDVDAKQSFVRANGDNLNDQAINLNEQMVNLEQVDMADAITQFMWDYNCYNAALKIGTQLLTGSLIDYMA